MVLAALESARVSHKLAPMLSALTPPTTFSTLVCGETPSSIDERGALMPREAEKSKACTKESRRVVTENSAGRLDPDAR